MTYHANHSWCSNSNWDNKMFDSEVMVYFGQKITRTDIMESYNQNNMENLNKIKNPDFYNLTEIKHVIHKKEYDFIKKIITSKNPNITEEELNIELKAEKDFYTESIYILKKEVVDWLNENIKDENEEKCWCVGNDEYIINDYNKITIFFKREFDALKFIRTWSIFKEPVFYFDYFSDDRRNMDLNKLIHILSKHYNKEIEINDIELNNDFQGNINLDPLTFRILDWNKEDDDISLNKDEQIEFVKKLYEKEDIKYENNNISEYKEYFKLRTTDKISLGYEEEI